MLQEHDDAGELTHRIELLSNNYTPPVDACNTYKALYTELKSFAEDLYRHIHLENNILFPKLLKLEKSFH
jgi:regulator of cell morphogenesis and NO signaling